jgi:hypothetical protein
MLAAVAPPLTSAASLTCDYGAVDIGLTVISLPGLVIFGMWAGLMWHAYRLPGSSGANWFGLPPGDLSGASMTSAEG